MGVAIEGNYGILYKARALGDRLSAFFWLFQISMSRV